MDKGIYCLVVSLNKDVKISVGSREKKNFPKGFYCYVGSGMNGLAARIDRHLSGDKTKHWHIDYLLDHGNIISVKTIPTEKKIECEVSDKVKKISSKRPVKGFGSSDCKCDTHLHYFEENPLANEKFISIFEL